MDFGKTCDKYTSLLPSMLEVEVESTEYLKDVCERNGGVIDLSCGVDDVVCVGYDGGNHPETANNMYSTVQSVFIGSNDELCVGTEDCDELPVWRLSWEDVYGVATFVYEYIDKND